MADEHPSHSEIIPPDMDLRHPAERFTDVPHVEHVGIWTTEEHAETTIEKTVRRTLRRIHLIAGISGVVCALFLLIAGRSLYHRATYVDRIQPDYSALNVTSSTYWHDRILQDLTTARQSAGTEPVRRQRLLTFVYQTMNEAMRIPSPYNRAQAVTGIVRILAQQDVDISVDRYVQQLGSTNMVAAMHARTLISQTLMYLRQGKNPAALNTFRQYSRLATNADLKLNSALNEESFCGAVTILKCLDNSEGLVALFNHHKITLSVLNTAQRMKAYRLIAGEQARVGMTGAALETAQLITYPVELVRAWSLILYFTARPPKISPTEPAILRIPIQPPTEPPPYPYPAEQAAHEIFQFLAEKKDAGTQTSLLRRLAGSRLMCDSALHTIIRRSIIASPVLDEYVKQPVLNLLDDPESPTIRAALKMPPRPVSSSKIDTALDDGITPDGHISLEPIAVDSAALRTQNNRQEIEAWLAVSQGYQSVRRFRDADRILKETFSAAQQIALPNVRYSLLLRIGEQQIAVGSIGDAQRTFSAVASLSLPDQKEGLVRLQIIARLFDDAYTTLSAIKPSELRDSAGSLLLQEQIRIHDLHGAEKTWALLSPGKTAADCRCRLNIAQENANSHDFETLGISLPEGQDAQREQHCIELIRQGFLHAADQAATPIDNAQKRHDVQMRIASEYQRLYSSLNEFNDPKGTIRPFIRQSIVSIAARTGEPIRQTTILTELLMYLVEHIQTEQDRTEGKEIWQQAINSCRNIADSEEQATMFAALITIKNILEAPDFSSSVYPFFTRRSNPSVFDETNRLVDECLILINSTAHEVRQGHACIVLAQALAQVGRVQSAQTLHERALDIISHLSDRQESIPMILAMIPTLKALRSTETIPVMYQLAIDEVIREFVEKTDHLDEYEWRMRDSEIEWIVRSQMENGFMEDAIESTKRLNEPVLRDRLLRSAVYYYLDQGDLLRAEWVSRQMTVKSIQNEVMRNIQMIKREGGRSAENGDVSGS